MERYSRQLILPEIGEAGQLKLAKSRVLMIGAGGLGSPAALYLAAAGVGTIGIVDGDKVDLSNLQRQILHCQSRIGKPKPDSAAIRLHELNDTVTVIPYNMFADETNILPLIQMYDFVIDASDQIENKFFINDACVLGKKPFVHAGIQGFSGQIMTYVPEKGPCYRCIFEDVPEKESVRKPIGVIGMTGGILGALEAMEALKYLLQIGELLIGKMLILDGLQMQFRKVSLPKASEHCRVCSENGDIRDLNWYQAYKMKKK